MILMKRLWNDEAGFVVSSELVLIATIGVLGLIVGITSVRDSLTSELSDVAGAIQDVNQSYQWFGVRGHAAVVAGSDYGDNLDYCDEAGDPSAIQPDNCITIGLAVGAQDETGFAIPFPAGP